MRTSLATTRASLFVFSLGLSASLAGCDEALDPFLEDVSGQARLAVESVTLTETESAALIAIVDGIDLSGVEGDVASRVADAAESTYTPSDCVTAIAAGGTVTYDYDGCAGPRGLADMTGNAVATFAVPANDSVAVTLTATEFVANGTSVTLNAQGEYAARTANQELTLTTTGGGVTDDGDILSRLGTYVASWDSTCLTLNGSWSTTVGTDNWTTGVSDYTICEGSCPADGGRIVFTEANLEGTEVTGSALTVSFDGTNEASYVSSAGLPGSVTLACP